MSGFLSFSARSPPYGRLPSKSGWGLTGTGTLPEWRRWQALKVIAGDGEGQGWPGSGQHKRLGTGRSLRAGDLRKAIGPRGGCDPHSCRAGGTSAGARDPHLARPPPALARWARSRCSGRTTTNGTARATRPCCCPWPSARCRCPATTRRPRPRGTAAPRRPPGAPRPPPPPAAGAAARPGERAAAALQLRGRAPQLGPPPCWECRRRADLSPWQPPSRACARRSRPGHWPRPQSASPLKDHSSSFSPRPRDLAPSRALIIPGPASLSLFAPPQSAGPASLPRPAPPPYFWPRPCSGSLLALLQS